MPELRETWVVRHDAQPNAIEFSYDNEEKAREAFAEHGFYDPRTGWGVTLIHKIAGQEILATTKPREARR